jgi:hypothetical protein
MRALAIVLLITTACASQPSPSASAAPATSATPTQQSATAATAATGVTAPTRDASESFSSSLDRVWDALLASYPALGLKANAIDDTLRAVGYSGIIRRRIGKVPISTYFGCGRAAGEYIADSYDITLVVASQVTRGPDGKALVTTHARAGARAPQFSGDNASCTSTGRLERAIFDSLNARLHR